jgi:hypothetical protein
MNNLCTAMSVNSFFLSTASSCINLTIMEQNISFQEALFVGEGWLPSDAYPLSESKGGIIRVFSN